MTLAGAPALRLAELVRTGRVSAMEVLQEHFARIEAADRELRAFTLVRREAALEEAAVVDRSPDRGSLPLAGVPVAVKDAFQVAGTPTRHGSAASPHEPASGDDEAVRRLRAAGAVVIGKTAMPELAIWGFTESAAHGVTGNPWASELTPGGSTGGGAAAVAAGMAPLALATDGGGSIRIPAACCGLVGMKPESSRVPLFGGRRRHWHGLTSVGPLATTAADAAAMLDVLAGVPVRPLDAPPRLRIAVSERGAAPGSRATGAFAAAVDAAAAMLLGAGHRVEAADPPYRPTLALDWTRLWLAGIAEDAAGLDPAALEPRTRRMVNLGRRLPAGREAGWRWRARMEAWFAAGRDLLLLPVIARRLPAGGWTGMGLAATLGRQLPAYPFTQAWNLADLPALAVPAGLDGDGLPLSVQLVGPVGSERRLLEVAGELEGLRPWPRLAPAWRPRGAAEAVR